MTQPQPPHPHEPPDHAHTPRRPHAHDAAAEAHALFNRALDLPPGEREALLREAGDPALESRVRRLLAAADRRSDFLESPAIAGAGHRERMPDAVGTYTVLGVLGVGGMATVYEAEQDNPRRRVALKVMHHRLSHTDAFLRFRLETEALARLRHPGIAQIYEAGTARLDRPEPAPFFAMELVPEALTITAFAERHALPLADRLRMFAGVCDAVTHGHLHAVIHRDLKPGNILVGPDGRAKVIDFGIARTTDDPQRAVTVSLDARRLIGTLNYMSPEQCGAPAGVDARADVYALGVILYELATGRLPYDLSGVALPEAVRIITEREPPGARAVNPALPRDLDAVIARAMTKDRDRRYTGADALAADIRRLLEDRPVEARHPGSLETLARLARRNRPLTAAVAALALALVAGIAATSRFAVLAARARDAALQRGRDLETVTAFQDSLLRDIDVPRMGDHLRRLIAERAAAAGPGDAAAFDRVAERVNFTSVAIAALDDNILQPARRSIDDRFAAQPALRARLLISLANTMNVLGLYAEAEPAVRTALDLRRAALGPDHEDTLVAASALGSLLSRTARLDEALALLADTHAAAVRALGPEHDRTLRIATTLAGVHRRMGHLEEAERLWRSTLDAQRRASGPDSPDALRTLSNLGVALAAQGRIAEAEACWRELLERRARTVGTDHPDYTGALGNLAVLLQDQGRYTEARALLEQGLAADRRARGDRHDDTLTTMSQLGALLIELDDLAAAELLLRECYEGRRDALGPENDDTLRTQSALGWVLHRRERPDEGRRLTEQALETQRRVLPPSHPDVIDSLRLLAHIRRADGRTADALALGEESLRLVRAAPGADPVARARALADYARTLADTGRADEARPLLAEAHQVLRDSVGPANPHARQVARDLADLFAAAHRADPDAGHDAEAQHWAAAAGAAPPQ